MKRKPSWIGFATLICGALLAHPGGVFAQGAAPATPAAADKPTVTAFDPSTIQLGSTVTLIVPDLDKIKDRDHPDATKAILYINGRPLSDAHPRRDGSKLIFDVQDTADSSKTWVAVLGSPNGGTRNVDLTVGFGDGSTWPSTAHGKIAVISCWFWICSIFVVALVIMFCYYAINTNILRDTEPDPGSNQKKTLSLARMQMAIWFFVVLSAFLLIWSITGQTSFSTTALTLLGISVGTGLAGTVVDSNKRTAAKTQVDSLTGQRSDIIKRIQELRPGLAAAADADKPGIQNELDERTASLAAVNNQLAAAQRALAPLPAQGAVNDLLTDANGAALHRFQMAAWTIVLVVVFLRRAYVELAMPDLDAALLALMGISNGTYIGFKVPEKQS
jgi:hypothetical protein